MGSREAQHRPNIGYDESQDYFKSSQDIPSDEHPAIAFSKSKCDAKIDQSGNDIQTDLYIEGKALFSILSNVP